MGDSGRKWEQTMYGSYERNLDEKNRIVIPTKFREELGETFYITLSFDKCLELRNQEEFKEFSLRLSTKNLLNENLRKISRFLLSNTIEVSLDKTGRVTLSEALLNKAAIEKEIVFIGTGNKAEIWSKEKYSKFDDDLSDETNVAKILDDLSKSGIDI